VRGRHSQAGSDRVPGQLAHLPPPCLSTLQEGQPAPATTLKPLTPGGGRRALVCRLLALAAALDETSAPTARISEGRPRGGRGGVRTGFCASSFDDDESDASEESDTPEESDMVSRACRTLALSGLGHASA